MNELNKLSNNSCSINFQRKLILVSGFARGGTNIAWNLITSHPGILTTGYELNEIYSIRRTNLPLIWKYAIEASAILHISPPNIVKKYMGSRIIDFAKRGDSYDFSPWKTQYERYNDDELNTLPICTKSVSSWTRDNLHSLLMRNVSLKYNTIIKSIFPNYRIVFVIRDAEAVCNGWMRRGCSPELAGKWYRIIAKKMLLESKLNKENVIFIKFSDVVSSPEKVAKFLHDFCGLESCALDSYRLKSKSVLNCDGTHRPIEGKCGEKKWVSSKNIGAFMNPDIDKTQRSMLSVQDRNILLRELKGVERELYRECVDFQN